MAGNEFRIMACGDIFPADHYFSIGHGWADPRRVHKALSPINRYLNGADVVLGNLEAPLSHHSKVSRGYRYNTFRGDPACAKVLKRAGFSHLGLANNHMLQHGEAAFHETRKSLVGAGISPVGIVDESGGIGFELISCRGITVALIAASLVQDSQEKSGRLYNRPRRSTLLTLVSRLSQQADHVILFLHWGIEGMTLPSLNEVVFGRKLIEAGASLIFGHHPHILRPVERWQKGLIFYSLGNLLFDLEWHYPYTLGMLADVRLREKGKPLEFSLQFTRFHRGAVKYLTGKRVDKINKDLEALRVQLVSLDGRMLRRICRESSQNLERSLALKKLSYFLRNLHRGKTREKLEFLKSKVVD